jgi:hypothetical protein
MGNDAESTLSDTEIRDLRDIAGTMIPASPAIGMPGAGDPAIQTDLVRTLGRDLPQVRAAIAAIVRESEGAFADLDRDRQEALISDYHAHGGAAARALGRVILAAYYRDDRVLVALGQEARAPFPKGHSIEQGDWSLLDPVRRRAPFWRNDRTGGER